MTHHFAAQRLRALLSLVFSFSLILSLSACSSDGSSGATPSASASSPESFAITATEGIENPELPERPAEMDNYDEDGAMAAAEYFLRLSLYGFATGDWEYYDALSASDCGFCQSYRDNCEKGRTSSVKRNMPEMKIKDAVAWHYEENAEQIRVNVVAERYPHISRKSDGTITNHEGETTALAFLLEFTDDWHIVDVIPFDVDEYYEDVNRGMDE